MKVGDTFPVSIAGVPAAVATATFIDGDEVTLEIPATRVVAKFKTHTELSDERRTADTSGTQRIVDEVVRQPAEQTTTITNPADTSAVADGTMTIDKPETKTEAVETKTDATEVVTGS